MKYRVEVKPSVDAELKRIPKAAKTRIVKAMFALEIDPRPHGVIKLSGEANLWRIRVGEYRILYEIHDSRLVVLVLRVAHRRDVYR